VPAAVKHEAAPRVGRLVLDGATGDEVLPKQGKATQGGECTEGSSGCAGAYDYLGFGNGQPVGFLGHLFLDFEQDVFSASLAPKQGSTLVSYRIEQRLGCNAGCLMEAKDAILVLKVLGEGEQK